MVRESVTKDINILCPGWMLTTSVSFDLASPSATREQKHQQQLLDFPGSLQVHTASQGGMLEKWMGLAQYQL